jgi:lipopolysaccharide transport system permease protein
LKKARLDTLRHQRELVFELLKREFSGRYQGSFGGVAWSFAQPLFLLAVYTVAFGVVLQSRWGFGGGTTDYALMLFAGLIVYNAFAECLQKAPGLVTSNPNFVKKVAFPLGVLPFVMALNAIIHALIGTAVWLVFYAMVHGAPWPSVTLVPVVLLCYFPVLLGVGWLFAAVGVIVRDVGQLANMLSHALLFLTPIFYGIDAVPAGLRPVLLANPLTFVVEQLRLVLYFGQVPVLSALGVYFVLACVFAGGSWLLFRRLRPSFAEMV